MGYEGYWIDMPKSVKEGFLHEFAKIGKAAAAAGPDDDDDQSRASNIQILELISAWNIDDDAGKVLPLVSKCKTRKEKEAVVAELPVDVIVFVAQRIAGNVTIPEKTKDF